MREPIVKRDRVTLSRTRSRYWLGVGPVTDADASLVGISIVLGSYELLLHRSMRRLIHRNRHDEHSDT